MGAAHDKPVGTLQTLERMARDGDVCGVVQALAGESGYKPHPRNQGRFIRQAIDSARAKRKLTNDLLDLAIATSGEVYVRLAARAQRLLVSFDTNAAGSPQLDTPREVIPVLEQLGRIEDRLVLLAKARATVEHVSAVAARPASNVIRIDEAKAPSTVAEAQ